MAERSSIEWTSSTWTPIRARNLATGKVGWHCEHASEGCRHCYSERQNTWLGTGLRFDPKNQKRVELFLDEKLLARPLSWRSPRRVFVCSMTDLFADFVSNAWISRLFDVMHRSPLHTFQVLTKRPARMLEFCSWAAELGLRALPNLWLGVSVEDQATADERIPLLLQTPAAKRFVSYEPALGPVDFDGDPHTGPGWLRGYHSEPVHVCRGDGVACHQRCPEAEATQNERLDWVIVGGESGPRARPFDVAWARSVLEQCKATGVPVFVKQLGANTVIAPFQDDEIRFAKDPKKGDPDEWPPDLRVREFPA